jgi:transposase
MPKRDARTLGSEAQWELRRRAVNLKRDGYTHDQIAELLDVSEVASRKWWKQYKQGGLRALKPGKRGRREGMCRTLSRDQELEIRKLITDRTPEQLKMPFALWTRQAVQEVIARKCKVTMPIRSVGEYLRRWGFTPQRPRKRAYDQQPTEVKRWLKQTYPKIARRAKAEGAEIHWCDETGVSSEDHRGRGYAPRGSTPVAATKAERFSASMISSVTNRGKLRFMIYRRGLKTDTFITFLRRLIRSTNPKVFLIVDNLQVHRARKVREWVHKNRKRIELFYLPPYSPELNPDEYLNNTVKSQLRKKPAPRCRQELQYNMRRCMFSNQRRPRLVRNMFNHPYVQYAA